VRLAFHALGREINTAHIQGGAVRSNVSVVLNPKATVIEGKKKLNESPMIVRKYVNLEHPANRQSTIPDRNGEQTLISRLSGLKLLISTHGRHLPQNRLRLQPQHHPQVSFVQ
jgi:hypothetical protein